MNPMTDSLLCRRDGTIATVTINRPEKRNAMDAATWRALGDAFEDLSRDEDLRCVVMTGAGGKAFGSGNDISEFETGRANSGQVKAYNEITARAVHAIETCLHPTVARIEGFCLGGGLEIALACDIRIATAGSTFGLPVKNMGIYLDPALADTLVNTVGRAVALEMVMEGRVFTAEEALARGIVTRVVVDGELDAEIAATAERISGGAPLAQRYNRRAIRGVPVSGAVTDEVLAAAASYGDTEDYKNAYQSFAAKKKPEFRGR